MIKNTTDTYEKIIADSQKNKITMSKLDKMYNQEAVRTKKINPTVATYPWVEEFNHLTSSCKGIRYEIKKKTKVQRMVRLCSLIGDNEDHDYWSKSDAIYKAKHQEISDQVDNDLNK